MKPKENGKSKVHSNPPVLEYPRPVAAIDGMDSVIFATGVVLLDTLHHVRELRLPWRVVSFSFAKPIDTSSVVAVCKKICDNCYDGSR